MVWPRQLHKHTIQIHFNFIFDVLNRGKVIKCLSALAKNKSV